MANSFDPTVSHNAQSIQGARLHPQLNCILYIKLVCHLPVGKVKCCVVECGVVTNGQVFCIYFNDWNKHKISYFIYSL